MKITHIIGIVVIAVVIGIIVSTSSDASQYKLFNEAREMAADGDDEKIHVIGKLKKDRAGNILGMHYAPEQNIFTFRLVDSTQNECQVYFYQPKPQDFEKSEQVVVVGNIQDSVFVASQILMKCPSKYENQEPTAGM